MHHCGCSTFSTHVNAFSTIQGLEEEAGKLKRGTGFRAFLKGFIRKSRDEEAISDMKDTLATAIQTFQVSNTLQDVLAHESWY